MSIASREIVRGPRAWTLLGVLTLVSIFSQIDRILPYILAESIRTDLGLSDTQIGLITGLAFAVCYTVFSLPLARAADRGSPRLVLLACLLVWSLMTGFGGLAGLLNLLTRGRTRMPAAPHSHSIVPGGLEVTS